jgi:hypothetical protein
MKWFDKLTEKERKAINLVIRGRNKSQALREIGYGENYIAHHIGDFWNRDHIQTELKRRRTLMAKRADIDADWIVERLKAIADLDVATLIEQDEDGRYKPVGLAKLPASLRKALSVSIVNGHVKITQNDRLKALDQLARTIGVYEDKMKVEGEISLTDKLLAGRSRAALRNDDSE